MWCTIHYIKQHKHFLKLSFDCFLTCNVFGITCCINMKNFNVTSIAVLPVTIYIVLWFQHKIFTDTVQKYFISGRCCGKSAKSLGALLHFFFPTTYLTYFSDKILFSTVLKIIKFIFSIVFSIFKIFFLF